MVARSVGFSVGRPVGIPVTGDGVSGGSSPSFSPTDIANLSHWLDASDSSTVLNSISPNTSATDGQTVRRWLDKSGNDRHSEQSTGSLQPLYKTAELNDKAILRLDGTDDLLTSTLFPTGDDVTFFIVLKRATDAKNAVFISSGSNYLFAADSGSTAMVSSGVSVTNRVNGVDQSWSNRIDVHNAISTGAAIVYSSYGTLSSWSRTAGALRLPGWGQTGNYATFGDVAEMIIYSAQLSSENIETVESYLAAKWGVTF